MNLVKINLTKMILYLFYNYFNNNTWDMSLDILHQQEWTRKTWNSIVDRTRRSIIVWIGSFFLSWCKETQEAKEKRELSEKEAQEKKEREKNRLNQLIQEKINHLRQWWVLKIRNPLLNSFGQSFLVSNHWQNWTVWVTLDKDSTGFLYWEDIYKVHLDEKNLPKEMKEKGVRLLDLNDFEMIK